MFLTIITPFKGDVKKLEITLNSYKENLQKAKFDYEILIITSEYNKVIPKLKYYKKLRINLLKEEQNNGIYPAMNIGIESSKGEYINFINCGDLINKSFTEFINSIFESNLKNKTLVSFTVAQKIRNKNHIRRKIPPKSIYCGLIYNPWSHCGILFPGKYIRESKYSTKYKCGADYEKILNLLFTYKLKYKRYLLKYPAVIMDLEYFSFKNKNICLNELKEIKSSYALNKSLVTKIFSQFVYSLFYFEQFIKKRI